MAIIQAPFFLGGATESAYAIEQSIMLDGSADYLTLTPSFDASNNTKVTFSWWQKRSNFGTVSWLYDAGSNNDQMQFAAADDLEVSLNATTDAYLNTTALFRDPTAWQHFVVSFDTGNSTSGDRMRVWNNGTEITNFDTDNAPSVGYALDFLAKGIVQNLGRRGNNSQFWGGYLAEFIGLDGISVTDASKFGETDNKGVWIPKDPSSTDNISDWGGSNSFWLKFADATNLGFNSRPTELTANAGTYKIDNSLWLDGSSNYLYRTPSSGSASQQYTLSIWFKRGTFSEQYLFMQGPDASNLDVIEFTGDHRLQIRWYPNTVAADLITTQVFLDPTAWQHLVISVDTTLGAAGNRIKIYVNGVRVTAFDTQSNPSINATSHIGDNSQMTIGRKTPGTTWYYPGYLAEYIFLDGYAGTATDFGGWDSNGNWLPVDPTTVVTNNKGTNGFHLDFADPSAPGNDVSGNNNDFAVGGTIATTQTTTDSPTNTSGDNEGNYITFSPIDKNSNMTITNGNLTVANTGAAAFHGAIATQRIPNSGKYYFEVTLPSSTLSNQYIGVVNETNKWDFVTAADGSTSAGFYGFYPITGTSSKVDNGSTSSYGGSIATSSVLGFCIDKDNDEMYVSDDGTFLASSNPVTRANPMLSSLPDNLYVAMSAHNSTSITFNFGETAFAGTIPTGYVRLNTAELSAPTVTDPRAYWSNSLYYGTAQNRSVRQCFDSTGTAWTPDFVWIKGRSHAGEHVLLDSVRGVTKVLTPDSNAAEFTDTKSLTSFDEGGFTLGLGDDRNDSNDDGKTYVAWCMKAGGAASSNGNGSITSSVSAADHGGFSIATWTGNGSAGATIGHGLSRKPAMGIFRRLSLAQDWAVYHDGLDASAPEDKYVNLNLTNDVQDATWLNDTAPTTSVWTLGTSGYVNTSSETFVGYFFARTPGLIGIGTYTGNNSTDGPFVVVDDGATGFRPAFLIIKEYSGSNNGMWFMRDSARSPYNSTDLDLYANSTDAEYTDSNSDIDFTANGFKIRANAGGYNESGAKNLYIAFADQPFNLAKAR
tara:strand:- start:226 stop:3354 length:3129 start_codon:yes stop_codon:yes gene_type:complete